MAATAQRRYGQGAVYGSLAYDFNNPELYAGEEYSLPRERETPAARPKTKTRTQVRTRARHALHTRQSIAPLSIIGAVAAAFLCVTAITAQVQLVSVSGDSVALESQLNELEETQARLRIAYERSFNLAEVEEYATTVLGMQEPGADQVTYIDTSLPDRAVVVSDGSDDGFVDRTADLLSGFGAYFK